MSVSRIWISDSWRPTKQNKTQFGSPFSKLNWNYILGFCDPKVNVRDPPDLDLDLYGWILDDMRPRNFVILFVYYYKKLLLLFSSEFLIST